jgi:hypothetical protein
LEAVIGVWIRARLQIADAGVHRTRGHRGRARRVLAVDGKAMRATRHSAHPVHLYQHVSEEADERAVAQVADLVARARAARS